MCKVLMVAGIKKKNVDKVWKFVKAIAKPMSRVNDDGIGYAAITADGNIFGERWLKNSTAFSQTDTSMLNERVTKVFGSMVNNYSSHEKIEHNSFGEIMQDKAVAITLHTRAATTPIGLLNTHPFVEDGVSLIHNGVIRNYEKFDGRVTTCDSEAILKGYLKEGVREDAEKIKELTLTLQGYYACGVLTNTSIGPTLDVFKSTGARLNAAFINELDTWVLSTDDGDIKDVCKELGFTMSQVFNFMPNKFIRINAITGEQVCFHEFEELKETYTPKYNNYPTPTTTPSTKSGGHKHNMGTQGTKSHVYPFPKQGKRDTPISEEMMDYFRAGKRNIVALSEREIQEEIMNQERFFGGW